MTELRHKEACKYCPMRKTSAPGYLGDSNPEEFLDQIMSEAHMPCHCGVDYDRDDWRDQLEKAPHCSGTLIFMKNQCKLPVNKKLCKMMDDVSISDEVFGWQSEFLDHHKV